MEWRPTDRVPDYSNTRRVALLIDLIPLLHLENSATFISSIISSAHALLNFPPLASSLFSFKLFFSSLSPLLSSSKLHPFAPSSSSLSLSFNNSSSTMASLSCTLDSLARLKFDSLPRLPLASCLSESLHQLLHDYTWESLNETTLASHHSMADDNNSGVIRSNLVVLFSPVPGDLKMLGQFFGAGTVSDFIGNNDLFIDKLCQIFGKVSCAFVSRDIQFSWIDFRHGLEGSTDGYEILESEFKLRFFENAIRTLGWGFCSIESIVLGCSVVPFGLIYPKIGVSASFFHRSDANKKLNAPLILQISDVSGNPLHCKCCQLEFAELKMFRQNGCRTILLDQVASNSNNYGARCDDRKRTLEKCFGVGSATIHINGVKRYADGVEQVERFYGPFLVCEFTNNDSKKAKEKISSNFFPEVVLRMLAMDLGEYVKETSAPTWQILLSFLYKEGYCASVSLLNEDDTPHFGILMPFTFSTALVYMIEDASPHPDTSRGRTDNMACKTSADLQSCNKDAKKHHVLEDGKKRKTKKKCSDVVQNFRWSNFLNEAAKYSELDLGEMYSNRKRRNPSKKMAFLRCWMKQIKKSSFCDPVVPVESMTCPCMVVEEMDNTLAEKNLEGDVSISTSSVGDEWKTEASGIHDEDVLDFRLETSTSEVFFSVLPDKIEQGLRSQLVELGTLAKRLVNSSICWSYQKHDVNSSESSTSIGSFVDTESIVEKLISVLLRDPRELSANLQIDDLNVTRDLASRQFELQILLRMEILQSEVGINVGESVKGKLIRQICFSLEAILNLMEGGFFGDWTLDDYVEKIIKNRYNDSLPDVVHRIYEKMDLLIFTEDHCSPSKTFKWDERSQPEKKKQPAEEMDESGSRFPIMVKLKPVRQLESSNRSSQRNNQEAHDLKLIEAQARRERARRCASFSSWMPDLQRVWAPKKPVFSASKVVWHPRRTVFSTSALTISLARTSLHETP